MVNIPEQIVTYDIPDDKLRKKIADKLLDYGLFRIQYSVFQGRLSRNMIEMLEIEIGELLGKKDGDIRIFTVCERCLDKTIQITNNPTIELGGIVQVC